MKSSAGRDESDFGSIVAEIYLQSCPSWESHCSTIQAPLWFREVCSKLPVAGVGRALVLYGRPPEAVGPVREMVWLSHGVCFDLALQGTNIACSVV